MILEIKEFKELLSYINYRKWLLRFYIYTLDIPLIRKVFVFLLREVVFSEYVDEIRDIHEDACMLFEDIYHLDALNTKLRLMGALSIVVRFTSDILGFNYDLERLREMVCDLGLDDSGRGLDVAGLVGLVLLSKYLRCSRYRWASKRLKRIVDRRGDMTPQLVEGRFILGRRSVKAFQLSPLSVCYTLFNFLESRNCNTVFRGLNSYEEKVINLCCSIKKIIVKSLKIIN